MRARDLEFLLETSHELTSSLDLAAVLDGISRKLLEVVPAWRVGVLLSDEATGALRLAAGFVTGEEGPVPRGRSLDPDLYPEVARAMRTREPVTVDDVEQDELMEPVRAKVVAAGVRCLFVVPLVVRDHVLGVLSVGQRGASCGFSERERSLVRAVANQAAVAIRNAQLYGELQESARELEDAVIERTRRLAESHLRLSVLNEITAAVNVSLDVELILESALIGLSRLAGMDRVQVYLTVDAPAGRCDVYHLGDDGRLERHETDLPSRGDGAPSVLSLEGRWIAAPDDPESTPLLSHLLAPLVSKEGVVGAVQAFAARPGLHGDAELELLQQVAGEISIAVERGQLYRAEKRRSKQFELLSDVGRQLTGAITLENLLPTAARLVQRALGYSLVTILTLDEDEDILVVAGAASVDPAAERRVAGHRLPADGGLCGRAMRTGEPVLASDTSEEPDFIAHEGLETRAELCVPLRVTGEIVGVLDLQADRVNAFSEVDVSVTCTLADQLAAALHLSRLFDDLQRHREFTDQIINNLTGGLIVTDRRRIVQVVNFRGAEILRVDRWDLLGRDLLEVVPTAGSLLEYSPDSISRECEVVLPDGERVPIGFSNAFFADTRAGNEAIIITFRELTEIRELQRKVRHAERLATIGTVAAGVAHEIRNPLFGISATAEILSSELPADEPLAELARGMLEETRRLNRLVESLVGYSRPQRIHPAPTDPVALVASVLEQARARQLEREVSVERHLPEAGRTIEADADQLRQVLMNLLVNAYDAARGGHVGVSLEWEDDGGVRLVVDDDGPGLTPEQIDRVFDLFYTTKPQGSGMGLAISSKIVEDHGGTIEASSSPSGGARFEVRMPARAATTPDAVGASVSRRSEPR